MKSIFTLIITDSAPYDGLQEISVVRSKERFSTREDADKAMHDAYEKLMREKGGMVNEANITYDNFYIDTRFDSVRGRIEEK